MIRLVLLVARSMIRLVLLVARSMIREIKKVARSMACADFGADLKSRRLRV